MPGSFPLQESVAVGRCPLPARHARIYSPSGRVGLSGPEREPRRHGRSSLRHFEPRQSPFAGSYSSAYLRILRRIKGELQAAEQNSAAVEEQSEDAADWLCPLHERDVAPLLGPAGVESVMVSQQVLLQLCESDESQAAFNPAAAVKAWRHGFLDLTLDAYLKLPDCNARRLVSGKSGAMDPSLPPILERLGLTANRLGEMVDNFERWFHGAVGSLHRMAEVAARTGRRWLRGINHARAGFC